MEQVRQAALDTVYPETGFAPDDPRLTPVGMPLVAYAVAAKAIGWASEDTALIERVLTALGHTHDDYVKAGEHWTQMLKTDMAVATLYGQLFRNAGDLPVKRLAAHAVLRARDLVAWPASRPPRARRRPPGPRRAAGCRCPPPRTRGCRRRR